MLSKKPLLAMAAVLLGAGYWSWGYVSSSHGSQQVSYETATEECGAGSSGWKYCIYRAKGGTNGGIAYLLHGRNLDEKTWNDDTFYTSMIQKVWKERLVKPPVVVSVSFGPIWILSPKNSSPDSGLLEKFVKEVIPFIEGKTGVPKYRMAFGESMGGLNALLLGLNAAGLFHKVVALCPALYKQSPFVPMTDVKAFIERTGAEPAIIYGMMTLAKRFVSNDEEWKAFSPLERLDQVEAMDMPKIYLSCGLYDKYGNFEGNEAFAQKAISKGMILDWHPLYGGHCAVDVNSVAEALVE